jgi:hypothetical protein
MRVLESKVELLGQTNSWYYLVDIGLIASSGNVYILHRPG